MNPLLHPPDQQQEQQQQQHEWQQTLTEFKLAIQDINQPFDQFYWIQKLFLSSIKYLLYKILHLKPLFEFWKKYKGHLVQFIPCFAIGLVALIVLGYDLILHDYVLRQRWCSSGSGSSNNSPDDTDSTCIPEEEMKKKSRYHLLLVHYVAFMIVWNYLHTTFTSPGTLIIHNTSSTGSQKDAATTTSSSTTTEQKSSNHNNIITYNQYKSTKGQGGCCYINPHPPKKIHLQIKKEQLLLSFYKQTFDPSYTYYPSIESNTVFIPKANTSFCRKCQVLRPPRCHHCSCCNRCVLQMDHHCIWINNCIGYNNYRYFFLTLFFLVIGCWYGMYILSRPYWGVLYKRYYDIQLREHEHENISMIMSLYEIIRKGKLGLILRIPTPIMIYNEIKGSIGIDRSGSSCRMHPELMLDIIVPFLVITGISLSYFFYTHCKLLLSSLTTLEHMAVLKFKKDQALIEQRQRYSRKQRRNIVLSTSNDVQQQCDEKEEEDYQDDDQAYRKFCNMKIVNPFDQGSWKNFHSVMGGWTILALLPIRRSSLPPYVPNPDERIMLSRKNFENGHLKTT